MFLRKYFLVGMVAVARLRQECGCGIYVIRTYVLVFLEKSEGCIVEEVESADMIGVGIITCLDRTQS